MKEKFLERRHLVWGHVERPDGVGKKSPRRGKRKRSGTAESRCSRKEAKKGRSKRGASWPERAGHKPEKGALGGGANRVEQRTLL